MKSLFLNNTDNDNNTINVNIKCFCRWLLQQDSSFKNAGQAITLYLKQEKDFIIGFNYIRLNNYLELQNSFKQLTVKTTNH